MQPKTYKYVWGDHTAWTRIRPDDLEKKYLSSFTDPWHAWLYAPNHYRVLYIYFGDNLVAVLDFTQELRPRRFIEPAKGFREVINERVRAAFSK